MPLGLVGHAIAGASFGAALVASGVSVPSVVESQLRLSNFQMAQTFVTAIAASA